MKIQSHTSAIRIMPYANNIVVGVHGPNRYMYQISFSYPRDIRCLYSHFFLHFPLLVKYCLCRCLRVLQTFICSPADNFLSNSIFGASVQHSFYCTFPVIVFLPDNLYSGNHSGCTSLVCGTDYIFNRKMIYCLVVCIRNHIRFPFPVLHDTFHATFLVSIIQYFHNYICKILRLKC